MKPVVVVCGHGPGISDAVARRFGSEGHPVAIVARSAQRLDAAARSLTEAGVRAQGFACDLSDVTAVRAMISDVRAALGPIGVLHWNPVTMGAGDLLTADLAELATVMSSAVYGLVAAVQAALPDLRAVEGAVLVTGGGFALYDPQVDAMAARYGSMGVAISKAAQHKTAGLLHQRLKGEGVYVGEVVVLGTVKGTAWDSGSATLEASRIADRFWDLHQTRSEATVTIR